MAWRAPRPQPAWSRSKALRVSSPRAPPVSRAARSYVIAPAPPCVCPRMRRFVRHPGEVLACFLDECEVSQNRLARSMGVPPRRINEILLGKRGISADTAIALDEIFGMGEEFWMRL